MKKQNTGLIISLSILGLAVLAMIGLVGGVNGAVDDLEVALNENTANAILASAEVKNDTVVSVPILYYDQVMDECVNLYDGDTMAIRARQFEWDTCGYHESKLETGLVGAELDAEFLPVGVGGELLSNSGLSGDSFSRWFKSVEGKSKSYASVLSLTYDDRIASFGYRSEDFYPLDEIDLAADESVNSDGHNHLFTLSLGVPFRVLADGREEFSIEADDDTWVFVGNSLVIDMGGVHDAMMGRFRINEVGEVYAAVGNIEFAYTGVTLNEGDGAIVRIFHADRNSKSSLFGVRMTNMVPNVMKVKDLIDSRACFIGSDYIVDGDPGNDEAPRFTKKSENPIFSAGLQLENRGGKKFIEMGVLSKQLLKQFDLQQPVFYAELNWTQLMKATRKNEVLFTDIPKHPAVSRDLALLVDSTVEFAQIEQTARQSEKKLLRSVELFDVYEGKNLPAGKKSYAVNFILQDEEKTMNDKQIDTIMQKLIQNLKKQLGAELR